MLDVQGAYNLLRVKKGDEHMLSFLPSYGLFKPMVMQFRTTNTLADFEGYINNVIREELDDIASAYLHDVLTYSDPEEEQVGQGKWIMQRLLEEG
jgi:hypothetical protein